MHKNLIVTRESIHEVEQPIPGGRVDQRVDAWEREAIFWRSFVEVGEVHIHPLYPVGYLHQNYIGQPVRVMDFLDELKFLELLDLLSYSLHSFRHKFSSLLLHWLHGWVHIQMWHVFL